MEAAIIAGVAHDRSEAKITVVGVPDKVGVAARVFEALAEAQINLDMIVQNVSAAATNLTDISFTLPRTDGQTAMTALAKLQAEVGFERLLLQRPDRQGLADRRRHAQPPRHHRQVLLLAGRGRRQHRDDLHLRDPDLGHRRRGRRRPLLSRPPTRPSTWTPTRSRPWSTEAPADESPGLASTSASSAPPARSASRCDRSSSSATSRSTRSGSSPRLAPPARSCRTPGRRAEHRRRGRRDRRPERSRHRAVLGRSDHLACPGAGVRRCRCDRGRQLQRIPQGPGDPARRLGGQPGRRGRRDRGRARHHRQPQLHHDGLHAGPQAAARRRPGSSA